MLAIGVQNVAWEKASLSSWLDFAQENSAKWLDIVFEYYTSPPFLTAKAARQLRRQAEEKGISLSGHLPYLASAVDFNPYRQAATRKLMLESIRFASISGMAMLTVHPPYPAWPETIDYVARLQRVAQKEYATLARAAKRADVTLAIENVEPFNTADDLRAFVDAFDLQVTMDIGHWNISGKGHYKTLLKAFKGIVANMHIHDNDGRGDRHWPLGTGNIDWRAVFSTAKQHGFKGPAIIENMSRPDLVQSLEFLRRSGVMGRMRAWDSRSKK
ncbi:MAG: sugar phosphate isomerase/epimerase [Candidatus Aenigmarchaeota archaeon]|nr:sugar phosphate isomerase/epimerase [Candidatus Aenigmarchaeota archaeon]